MGKILDLGIRCREGIQLHGLVMSEELFCRVNILLWGILYKHRKFITDGACEEIVCCDV